MRREKGRKEGGREGRREGGKEREREGGIEGGMEGGSDIRATTIKCSGHFVLVSPHRPLRHSS